MSEPDFFATSGTLHPEAPSYVERPADTELYAALRRGEFCYVLTSRQMGKSSLMLRTAYRLRAEGWTCILLDLTAIGQNTTPEQWYRGLLRLAGEQLRLVAELDDCWNGHHTLAPLQRWLECLRSVILARCAPLVIFVDEIDLVRGLPFSTDEFFAAIRECYNRRAQDPSSEQLTFCLSGVMTPADLIRDTRSTPFNIGRRVSLGDFTLDEAMPLASGLARPGADDGAGTGHAQRVLRQVLFWTGGHPYLTQRLCQAVAEGTPEKPVPSSGTAHTPAEVDWKCEGLFFSADAGRRETNLLFVRERLLRSGEDLTALLQLFRRCHSLLGVPSNENDPLQDALRLSGVVREVSSRGGVRLRLRNRIYARAFDRAWIAKNLPGAERRRQRAAFLRGAALASAGAVLVVAVVGSLTLNLRLALHDREGALAAAKRDLTRAVAAELKAQQQGIRAERASRLARAEARLARDLQSEAVASRQETRNQLERLYVARGRDLADAGIPFEGLLWQIEALRLSLGHPDRERLQRVRVAALLRNSPRLLQLWHVPPPVWPLAYSQGGAYALAVDGHQSLHLWNARTGAELDVPVPADVRFAAFSPNGTRIAARTGKGLYLGRLPGSWLFRAIPAGGYAGIAFSRDGTRVLVGDGTHAVRKVEAATGRLIGARLVHTSPVRSACFNSDGSLVATGCQDFSLRVWRADGTLAHGPFPGDRPTAELVMDSRDRRLLVFGNGGARLWDLEKGIAVGQLPGHRIPSQPFSLDGKRLVTIGNLEVRLWDAETGRALGPQLLLSHEVLDAAFVSGSALLTTLTKDGRRTLWDAERGVRVTSGPSLSGRGCNGSLRNGDAAQLVSEGPGEIRLWAAAAASPPAWSLETPSPALVARFSTDGQRLVAACRDGVARVLPVAPAGEPTLSLRHGVGLRFAVFNREGSRIVTTGAEGTARIWDGRTGVPVGPVLRHGSSVSLAAFSPDGRRLATVSRSEDVQVWDVVTGRRVIHTQSLGCRIKSVWFGVDGGQLFALNSNGDLYTGGVPGPLVHVRAQRRLRSVSPWVTDPGARLVYVDASGRAQAWDSRSSRVYGATVVNGHGALCAALDPAGTRLVTGGTDLTAKVWDVASGRSLCVTLRHDSAVANVVFSSDGKQLATMTTDGTARVWETATGEPLTPAMRGRQFQGEIRFSPTGDRLLVTQENGDAQAWDLTPDNRPATDLALLAQVLSGQRIEGGAGLAPSTESSEQAGFRRLRSRYPAQFRMASPPEIMAHLTSAGEAEKSLEWRAAARELSILIDKRPWDRELLLRRARARCEVGHWQGAADDFTQALRSGAEDRVTWYQLALSRLLCGDHPGYRQACAQMLDRFEHSSETRERDLAAWTCVLAPLPATTRERALHVIDELLRSAPENVDWLQTRAFLLYRAGRVPEGLAALEQSRRIRGNDGTAPDELLNALLRARLGQRAEALRAYERGAIAEEGEAPASHHLLWDERGELILFRREAAAALRGIPAQSAP